MARQATGEVLVRDRRGGRTFALRFYAYGKRRYLTLGRADEGWSRERAEEELSNVLADVRRGIWRPRAAAAAAAPEPSFHEFASTWIDGLEHEGLAESTLAGYRRELSNHLLPFFAEHQLPDITISEVDRYRQEKVREGVLSASSINETIGRLAQILEVAVERELIDRNPARGRRRRLKQRAPQRTWLDRAEQIEALLWAAGQLDSEARVDRRATPRQVLLMTLTLAGPRIGEALSLRWRDVDLPAGRLSIRDSKTDAGIRQVDLVPALREALSVHKAQTRFGASGDFVFPTDKGRRANPSNIRNRILARAIERADDRLAELGAAPLPDGLTPHSLRRTFISLLLAAGAEVPYVMRQVGHADPKVTRSIYAQVMFRGEGERERLQALVEGVEWAPAGTSAAPEPATAGEQLSLEMLEPRTASEDPVSGRSWTRTRDLVLIRDAL
jgi:integrase